MVAGCGACILSSKGCVLRDLIRLHTPLSSLVGGHTLKLARHLETFVNKAAKRRELCLVELPDIESTHLSVEVVGIVLSRA